MFMLAKKILSLQHPQVLHWTQLFKTRSLREKSGTVLVSGEKLIRELAQDAPLKCLMTLEDHPEIPASERFLVSESILKKITGLKSPDGFAAEILLPAPSDLSSCQNLLILDRIADPGNLGTLLRTAYALSWDGVAATPGTVDFFNDKAIRAALGATFRLPYAIESPETIASWKFSFYIGDIEGTPLAKASFQSPRALILGNEGQGISPWAQAIGKKIHIPMRKEAESLNVAAAGAILLYAMRPL
jgi:RNA methyltransferase, TrmH family